MGVFFTIWLGQFLSLIGSELTRFALGVWVYQETGSITQFSLISVASVLPVVFLSPVAGVIVDRWNRLWIMIISDCAAGVCTMIIALLISLNHLEIWHIYLITALMSFFATFQSPAYTVLTTILVPKQQLARANGMVQISNSASQLISPALAGFLIISIKLNGIIIIDCITFLIAMITIWTVRWAIVESDSLTKKSKLESFFLEFIEGWHYIVARRGLLALLIFFSIVNLIVGPMYVLITPLVLSFASPSELGLILSLSGVGMLAGGMALSIWGGPKRSINGVLLSTFIGGVGILVMGLRPSFYLIAVAVLITYPCIPFFLACSKVIFQKKSPTYLQGRIFACYQTFLGLSFPISYGLAGPLTENLFEPLIVKDGLLASSLGNIIGTGTGRGIGLFLVMMGILTMFTAIFAYFYKPLKLVEIDLPDIIEQ